MKTNFIPTIEAAKLPLPAGKISIRHRQMRGVYQCFAGRNYITGASGDNAEEAALWLVKQYDVPAGTTATVHGWRETVTITLSVED